MSFKSILLQARDETIITLKQHVFDLQEVGLRAGADRNCNCEFGFVSDCNCGCDFVSDCGCDRSRAATAELSVRVTINKVKRNAPPSLVVLHSRKSEFLREKTSELLRKVNALLASR